MCGIVGYVGPQDAAPILLEGLGRLEYRGYDSAGVAVVHPRAGSRSARSQGRVADLAAGPAGALQGRTGHRAHALGHARRAHRGERPPAHRRGRPDRRRAQRHHRERRRAARQADGRRRRVPLADRHRGRRRTWSPPRSPPAPPTSSRPCARRCARSSAPTASRSWTPSTRTGSSSPATAARCCWAIGEKEMFVASDVAALVGYTRQVVYLDDGELATITAGGYRTFTLDDRSTAKSPSTIDWDVVGAEIGDHAHFLHQGDRRAAAHDRADACAAGSTSGSPPPTSAGSTCRPRGPRVPAREDPRLRLGLLRRRPRRAADRGPRPDAGDVGGGLGVPLPQPGRRARHPLRRGQPVRRDHRHPRRGAGAAAQGRPGDRHRQRRRLDDRPPGATAASTSTPARRCRWRRPSRSPRRSRRSRCSRCTSAGCATCRRPSGKRIIDGLKRAARRRSTRSSSWTTRSPTSPSELAPSTERAVHRPPPRLAGGAGGRAEAQGDLLRPRRGLPVGRAQARAARAGQPGHADGGVVPDDDLLDKNTSTLSEIKARRGPVVAVAHRELPVELADRTIVVPTDEPELDPILMSVPLQLLAYHAAVALGRDVDKPRNLAKSVTVE